MRCHDKGSVLDILKTPHAMKGDARTPMAQYACESCHGASPDHMNKPPAPGARRTPPAVVFNGDRKSPPAVINKVCLTCHENGLRMNWQGSQHQSNDLACTDCHQLHTTQGPMVTREKQPFTCFKCHAEQRALTLQYSHHPMPRGQGRLLRLPQPARRAWAEAAQGSSCHRRLLQLPCREARSVPVGTPAGS